MDCKTTFKFLIRIITGSIFIYAGVQKITDPGHFADILYGYDIFPNFSVNVLAIVLPFTEVLSGLVLVTGFLQRPSLLIINILLLCFILITGFNLLRGHQYDCGCFSFSGSSPSSHVLLILRDMVLLTAGIFLSGKSGRS